MVNEGEVSSGKECKVQIAGDHGSKEVQNRSERGLVSRIWLGFAGLLSGFMSKLSKLWRNVCGVGSEDPRRVCHCLKVGLALTVVSLFYYMRPLYESIGSNAMWAVLTVVVVFEYTVGATLAKGLNRVAGTFLAGALAIGVHWVAAHCGETFEAAILRTSVFLLASAATFSRFIPIVKQRFDYGAMIFVLTFSLVSVSGYRVEELFELAHHRFSTVVLGTAICMLICIFVRPVWAGQDLHFLIVRNLERISDSLDECVLKYFEDDKTLIDGDEERWKRILKYKSALNTKGTEDSLANFARWEPSHGQFRFQHPWNQYLKIGALTRSCAYCIEALNSSINSEIHAHERAKKHLSNVCIRLSSHSSVVLRELTVMIKTMKKSSSIEISIGEMGSAVQELQHAMKCLPIPPLLPLLVKSQTEITELSPATQANTPLMEVLNLVTITSLLVEISARIEDIVDAVNELASMTGFTESTIDEKKKQQNKPVMSDDQEVQDKNELKILQQA
ncbi:aluminum-activated malate transporter 10-like isoform X2 [Papaver somniferum]|uniref:aluminum-activated malate transporter 10-like isoform X2 n=1 Tax=Papaver somniferum TaxID=3469 RepID=UPI000E6F8D16|nr:aluminum-activated malate transporter 10-like isoform X2 [Papaver somniferum]